MNLRPRFLKLYRGPLAAIPVQPTAAGLDPSYMWYARKSVGSNEGEFYIPKEDGSGWTVATPGGGMFKITGNTFAGTSANIDLQNIPQTFMHLRIILALRSNNAALTDNAWFEFNADATQANYDREQLLVSGTTAPVTESLGSAAATSRQLLLACGNTALANAYSQHIIDIPNYADTGKLKMVTAENIVWTVRTTAGLSINKRIMGWASTAGISRITITPVTGTLWMAGSSYNVYGIRDGSRI